MLRFHSVFSRLFVSVFLALIGFAVAMLCWIQLVHNDSEALKNRGIARQIAAQIEPFLEQIEEHQKKGNRLQARFVLVVIKKSFDIFDENLNAKIGLYNPKHELILQTNNSELPKTLTPKTDWEIQLMPALSGHKPHHTEIETDSGYILWYESRTPPKPKGWLSMNPITAILLLVIIMGFVLWAIAKNLTRRISQMQKHVAQFGEGNFSVRCKEEGDDEISALARGFNQSANKIEQLINANNLLLAHASHEFRTPITRMRLQTEMLSMLGDKLNDKDKTLFDKRTEAINRDLNGLNDLIESILLVSRLDAGHALEQMQMIDFYELISEECQHFEQATLYGESIHIQAQPKLLTHLIRNLLNNAIIHGVPPMTVYVYGCQTSDETTKIPDRLIYLDNQESLGSLQDELNKTQEKDKKSAFFDRFKKDEPKKTTKNNAPPTNFAVLAVIDKGEGIPVDKREDIFSPFVRLKQEKKGSGLGLSLVAQIVEMHGGKIITDTWQGNTRFLAVLPVKQ